MSSLLILAIYYAYMVEFFGIKIYFMRAIFKLNACLFGLLFGILRQCSFASSYHSVLACEEWN